MAPGLYEPIYGFGVVSTFLILAVITAIAIAIGLIIASVSNKDLRIVAAIVAVAISVVVAWRAPVELISPHSCLSVDLMEVTAGKLPPDDSIQNTRYAAIGSTGQSLEDTFDGVYRVLLVGWLMSVAAVGALLTRVRSKTPKAQRADLIAKTNLRLTVIIAVAGITLAICVEAMKRYHEIGLTALSAYTNLPADGSEPSWIAAYKSYSSAVELHWGGVASMMVAAIYLTALGFIWLRGSKWGVPQGIVMKDSLAFFIKLASIGAPFATAALQQFGN
jgi:hypothetical protein